jgi:hypothetical protein
MMKVIVVFKRLLASGNDQHGRNLGFNFNKRDALSSVYKISMSWTPRGWSKSAGTPVCLDLLSLVLIDRKHRRCPLSVVIDA